MGSVTLIMWIIKFDDIKLEGTFNMLQYCYVGGPGTGEMIQKSIRTHTKSCTFGRGKKNPFPVQVGDWWIIGQMQASFVHW